MTTSNGSRRASVRRLASRAVAALAILPAASLLGCGDDEYKRPAQKTDFAPPAAPVAVSSDPVVPIAPLPGGDLREDLGIDRDHYGAYSGRDMRDKADIFWKLYYLSKALQEGHPPPEGRSALQAMQLQIRKFQPDKNVSAISEIIDDIRTGMEATSLEQQLSSKGIRTASLGWSGGEYDLTRELKAPPKAGFSTIRPSSRLSAQDLRLAAEFAGRHHKSPVEVAQERYQRAAEKTNELGDALDDERRQYGEHLIGRDRVDPSAGMGNPYEATFPTPPIR